MSGNLDQQGNPRKETNGQDLDKNKPDKEADNNQPAVNPWNQLKALMPKQSRDKKESDLGWWKTFGISFACYGPAFLLVLTSGFVSYFIFHYNQTSPQLTNNISSTEPPLTEQQVEEKIKKVLAQQSAIRIVKETSPLAEKYIDGQIKQEARDQAEKAAKDEIDKLKADWKGDLFGQISFPVIFAIASIFAAFAVKDILTKILEDQERKRIQQEILNELRNEIRNEIIPKAINHVLHELTAYTYWLEHQLLNVEINQIISEIKQFPLPRHKDLEERNKFILDKAIERLQFSLNLIADQFQIEDFKVFKSTHNEALTVKIKSIVLSKETEQDLIGKLNKNLQPSDQKKHYSQAILEKLDVRIDNLVDVELGLLIATLSKPQKEDNLSEVENRNEWLNSLVMYLKRDKHRESLSRVERLDETQPSLAPLPKE